MKKIAGCVIRDEHGRFLLVQERREKVYGKWNMPAGYVDEGETVKAAAIRETKEEVGYDVVVDDDPFYDEENTTKGRHYYAFLGRIVGGDLKVQTEELLDAAWMDFERIEQLHGAGKIREPWIFTAFRKAHENFRD